MISTRQMNFESIIAKIPVATEQFEVINHAPDNPSVSILDNKAVQTCRVSLRDQNNKLLQLNDARFELSLMFQKYTREPTRRMMVQPPQPAPQQPPQPTPQQVPQQPPQPIPKPAPRSIPQPPPQPVPWPTAQPTTQEPEIDLLQAMVQAKILDMS